MFDMRDLTRLKKLDENAPDTMNLDFGSIVHAMAALAMARPAQSSMMMRNPNTNDCRITLASADLVLGLRFSGAWRPASWASCARRSSRIADGRERCRNARSKRTRKAQTITMPRTAMASTPATRATALLIPEAMPTRS